MLSSKGIRHLSHGPFAAGTGLNFLHQHLYGNGVIFNKSFINGGTHKLAESIGNYCESKGVNIRTKSKVNSINIVNYRCDSVTLSTGENISAELFISGLDPQNTFNYLIGLDQLNPIFRTQLKNIKYRGSTARIHFALNTLPEIKGISENQMDTVFSISPSIEYIERASDSVKYGDISENPVLEFVIPTINYPNFAPTGKHVLSTTVQYAPYHLRNQHWSKELKEQLKNNVIRILETVIPGFSSIVDSSLVVTPVDLEHQFGLTEGNLNHGEMTLDQLMIMRPMLGYSHYNSPFENLFLCGSGTHPGGGLHGANGLNVAREILNK
jgi:phytoene dehydrogenase-like protein